MNAKGYLESFINLFYPRLCVACSNSLFNHENVLCTKCYYHLPKTNFHTDLENIVAKLFWGRVNIELATAWYFFQKGSKFQKIIHKLKYHGMYDIGFELGNFFAHELVNTPFEKAEIIVPVPLHPAKLKIRGYNQSEWLARGISSVMHIPVDSNSLIRVHQKETQTKMNRFDRWKNVDKIFHLKNTNQFEGKHILLVDDVVTTGSTLEACSNALLKANGAKVSVATLAVTL